MFDEPEELASFIEEHGGYWDGECKEASLSDWKWAVTNEDTRLSYWEWAYTNIKEQEED